ncbi:hypothetical protein M8C21_010665 [Ambrosia artemisiifolia]|uniref:Uncharacterized protein n=1 Tax=Ambrosia artemisiifolia TaxID=4212 RepID=A0AAD5CRW9_AMBAR|nr:hypothetical protein M8C21_010665 [Ambrosia artemisiifolia]
MVAAEGDHGELGGLEFRPQAKEDDNEAERELRLQLKEAGRRLLNPTDSVEELLHVLDQLWKLLLKVDQSPNNVMKEALSPPMKALVAGSLLEHSSMDVKVSVASCLCEITRITAPQAPYSDEELKGVFQCIVSSLENLSDKSSRFYHKRVAILDSVSKVRSCVIMLDLECDDLIVKLFEHFLNSVRDHHVGDIFSLMVNIMALVLEESEDISLDLLKPLLASVKNNSEGVLPVARKLGEAVFKKSADKIRPCLNKAMTDLGKSLVDYSQLLTSISEGTTDFLEHNDGSATNQPKVVDTAAENVSFEDAAAVASDADTVTGNEENVDAQQSKKPEGAADRSGSNLNIKLDTRDPAVEKSKNVESKLDTTTKSTEFETVNGENIAEKSPEIVVSVQKPLESEVADAPSQSGSQQEESQNKIQIKKGIRSKKKGPSPTVPLPTVVALTKVNEVTSDSEMRSPKRVRKKTEKAEENTPIVTTGSDVEPSKNSGKKVKTGDSGPKPAKSSGKKVDGGGSVAKKRKLSGKKAPELKKSKQDGNEDVEAGNSAAKKPKLDGKKAPESEKPKQDDTIEVEAGDSVAKKPKLAVNTKEVESKEDKKTKKDDKKATPKKIVYSRGKKESKSKTKSPGDNVKESGSGNAAEEPESEKEKSTETPKTGAKTGKKKRKMN